MCEFRNVKRVDAIWCNQDIVHNSFPFYFQLLERNMKVECKCHGVSGSCELKTCWRSVAPFRMVSFHINFLLNNKCLKGCLLAKCQSLANDNLFFANCRSARFWRTSSTVPTRSSRKRSGVAGCWCPSSSVSSLTPTPTSSTWRPRQTTASSTSKKDPSEHTGGNVIT